MKKLAKICAAPFLVSVFFLTPAAMAVVIKGEPAFSFVSEPATMLLLGISLVGLAGFVREKNRVTESRDPRREEVMKKEVVGKA